jgi:hypothetical protein
MNKQINGGKETTLPYRRIPIYIDIPSSQRWSFILPFHTSSMGWT